MEKEYIYAKGINGNEDKKMFGLTKYGGRVYLIYEKHGKIVAQIPYEEVKQRIEKLYR